MAPSADTCATFMTTDTVRHLHHLDVHFLARNSGSEMVDGKASVMMEQKTSFFPGPGTEANESSDWLWLGGGGRMSTRISTKIEIGHWFYLVQEYIYIQTGKFEKNEATEIQ